jgi:L-ascorbate metabolism protein UlaG (beta-lactamase superfamily)
LRDGKKKLTETVFGKAWRNLSAFIHLVILLGIAFSGAAAAPFQNPLLSTTDPSCTSTRLVAAGGQFPKDDRTLAVRWTGYSNFELVYNRQVILLDAYFDRGSIYPPLGFKAADLTRADVILIGHGHFDHMSDAASVAARTGAVVVGAPVTIEKLQTQSVDPKQLRSVTGRGGEKLQFRGFTVEPILGRHGEPRQNVTAAFNSALQSVTSPLTPEQTAEQRAIQARGTSDPRIIAEGTIAYLITLDTGFRIIYRDSGGKVTDFERAALQKVGSVDLALVATSAAYVGKIVEDQALEYVRTYKPTVYMPAHHDAPYNGIWRPTEPIFQAIKQEDPTVITVSKSYREPTCFTTRRDANKR